MFYFCLNIAVPARPSPVPPLAECSIRCPQLFQPICASNGETFNNACELEVANCKGQIMLHQLWNFWQGEQKIVRLPMLLMVDLDFITSQPKVKLQVNPLYSIEIRFSFFFGSFPFTNSFSKLKNLHFMEIHIFFFFL